MPQKKHKVVYQWTFCALGIVAEERVSMRYNNTTSKGVPLPSGWQVAFRALELPKIAERSAAKAVSEQGHHSLHCKVLGIALPLPELPSPTEEEQVGSLRVLSNPGGSRSVILLCAHVQGTEWFYYEFDSNSADTIDITHMVLGDVQCAALPNLAEDELDMTLNLIQHKKNSFSQLFAEAAWGAEEHRASSRGTPFDTDLASVGYEANPFLWPEGNTSQVCVAWTLPCSARLHDVAAEEMAPSKFGWHRLSDALSKGWSFPSPRLAAVQPFEAAELRSKLEEHAKWTERTVLWPCGYLGYLVRGNAETGTFEPDPAKWPLSALQAAGGRYSKIIVWYEWKHLTVGPAKKPHRVSMRVGHAIGSSKQMAVGEIDTGRCFAFRDPQGEQHVLTGAEILRKMRNMEVWGPSKYQSASGLLSWLQEWVATSDGKQYCDQPEQEEAAKAHLQEVMTELKAIASMKGVDLLIDGTDKFMDRLREGRHEEVELTAAILREPLRKFLSVSSAHGSKLWTCYSAVDAALDTFQHALANDAADATIQLARAMDGLSTIGPLCGKSIGPAKKPHRVSMRVGHAIGSMKPTLLVPHFDTDRCFKFSGPQGDYKLTGREMMQMLRDKEVWGHTKYEIAKDLLSHLQHFEATSDDNAYGDTLEKQHVAKLHLREVMAELEAIASMGTVDCLIDSTNGFIDMMRKGRRDEIDANFLEFATAELRKPLQKFLSVSSSHGCALRDCYATVDDALNAFQHALTENSADGMDQLARAMDGLSTAGPFPTQSGLR